MQLTQKVYYEFVNGFVKNMFIFSKKKILKNLLVLVLMVLALSNSHASQESFLEGTPLKVRVSAPSHKTLPEGFEESISFSGAAFYFYFHLLILIILFVAFCRSASDVAGLSNFLNRGSKYLLLM